MPTEPVLRIERDAPIAIVTLNRPEQMNALNAELRLAIEQHLPYSVGIVGRGGLSRARLRLEGRMSFLSKIGTTSRSRS